MDSRASAPSLSSRPEAPMPPSHRRAALRGFSLRPSPYLGLQIGEHHRVEGFLGQGGTAEIFLARDVRTGELVVIKRLKAAISENPVLRQRFLLEAKALASIHHPAVLRVLDIHEPADDAPWLVLEALRGESLGDYLKRNPVLPPEQAIQLAKETAWALEAVHQAGVVHRDVKPDNLFLVGPLHAYESVKVLDFGMARLAGEEHDESSTSILGTVQYMAPEQILVEPVSARTDVYALGMVLFRLVTGHLPFDAKDSGALLRHQLFSPLPPPSWLADELPPTLEAIIYRATRKDPANRFATMQEFARALEEIETKSDYPEPECSEVRPIDREESRDSYTPVSPRGEHAARVLARDFDPYALSSSS